MGEVTSAVFNVFHGGKLIFYPELCYQHGESFTVEFIENEFAAERLKALIDGFGYDVYGIKYGPPKCMNDELLDLVDGDGFNKLKEVAFTSRTINVYIIHKQPLKVEVRRRKKHVACRKRVKHVVVNQILEQSEINAATLPKPGGVHKNLSSFVKLIGKLNEDQRSWVVEMGFGNLLNLSVTKIDQSFIRWIDSRFDPITYSLKIREDLTILMDSEMVGWVLGVPGGDILFYPEKAYYEEFKLLKKNYKENSLRGAVKRSKVYQKLRSEKHNKSMFKQHFLLYTLSVLLCPMDNKTWISSSHVYYLNNASNAYEYNWGKYMLEWLTKYNDNWEVLGCGVLLLVIIYLDRIRHASIVDWKANGCRICEWTQDSVDKAIKSDHIHQGRYGKSKGVEGVVYGKPYPMKYGNYTPQC